MAKVTDFSPEEKDMLSTSIDLAIQSAVRLSNRSGQPAAVKAEYLKQADLLRSLSAKVRLT